MHDLDIAHAPGTQEYWEATGRLVIGYLILCAGIADQRLAAAFYAYVACNPYRQAIYDRDDISRAQLVEAFLATIRG